MSAAVPDFFEAHPSPSPELVPIGPDQLDRIDEDLHLGWAWHRHRYVYRRFEAPRILDAGCGTGLSTLGLARLNPGARVLGVDRSPRALALAAERRAAMPDLGVEFREHDLTRRLPGDPQDFVVCRNLLGWADDPVAILKNLATSLDPRGLLLATFPARGGRGSVHQLRRAVAALCPAEATLDERAEVARQLFHTLRADHPIRQYESRFTGPVGPSAERLIGGYLGPEPREWRLEQAAATLAEAGLSFLYASTRRPWQAGLVLQGQAPKELETRVNGLSTLALATLCDALDPSLHGDEYRIFAVLDDHEPHIPNWFERIGTEPALFDQLVPHRSGLAAPDAAAPGTHMYRAVTGGSGPIDPVADQLFRAIDGRLSCGAIDALVGERLGNVEPAEKRRARWLDLANHGFVLLESPDPRQNIDCVHLGSVRDRLDCACPRRWVRGCERHGLCSIDPVEPGDERRGAYEAALARLGVDAAMVCASCPDYTPEDAK